MGDNVPDIDGKIEREGAKVFRRKRIRDARAEYLTDGGLLPLDVFILTMREPIPEKFETENDLEYSLRLQRQKELRAYCAHKAAQYIHAKPAPVPYESQDTDEQGRDAVQIHIEGITGGNPQLETQQALPPPTPPKRLTTPTK